MLGVAILFDGKRCLGNWSVLREQHTLGLLVGLIKETVVEGEPNSRNEGVEGEPNLCLKDMHEDVAAEGDAMVTYLGEVERGTYSSRRRFWIGLCRGTNNFSECALLGCESCLSTIFRLIWE